MKRATVLTSKEALQSLSDMSAQQWEKAEVFFKQARKKPKSFSYNKQSKIQWI